MEIGTVISQQWALGSKAFDIDQRPSFRDNLFVRAAEYMEKKAKRNNLRLSFLDRSFGESSGRFVMTERYRVEVE